MAAGSRQNREAWPEHDGRIRFWLPLQGGGQVELTMTTAQAEQCAADLLSALIDAEQRTTGADQ
jgi:hypothetical protein